MSTSSCNTSFSQAPTLFDMTDTSIGAVTSFNEMPNSVLVSTTMPLLDTAPKCPLPFPPRTSQPTRIPKPYHESSLSGSSPTVATPDKKYFCPYHAERGELLGFVKKADLKKHEESFHETGQEWPCRVPHCLQIFEREYDYSKHLKSCHAGIPCLPASEVRTDLQTKSAFACGFAGCKEIFRQWKDRCSHIAKHMEDGMGMDQWQYATVIRNLLRQPVVGDLWKQLLDSVAAENHSTRRPRLEWNVSNTRVLRQKLECSDFRPGFNEFIVVAYQLGTVAKATSSAKGHQYRSPKWFSAPTKDSFVEAQQLPTPSGNAFAGSAVQTEPQYRPNTDLMQSFGTPRNNYTPLEAAVPGQSNNLGYYDVSRLPGIDDYPSSSTPAVPSDSQLDKNQSIGMTHSHSQHPLEAFNYYQPPPTAKESMHLITEEYGPRSRHFGQTWRNGLRKTKSSTSLSSKRFPHITPNDYNEHDVPIIPDVFLGQSVLPATSETSSNEPWLSCFDSTNLIGTERMDIE